MKRTYPCSYCYSTFFTVTFVLFVLSTCTVLVGGAECTWSAPDGNFYDFSELGRETKIFSDRGYKFYVNPCNGTIPNCGYPPKVSPVCQEWVDGQATWSLGELNTQNISTHPTLPGLRILYTGGTTCGPTPRSVRIDLICNYDVDDLLVVDVAEGLTCQYTVTVESKHGCPVDCPVGFRGHNCSDCLPGHFGPECDECECEYGTCMDGIENNGTCVCETGWDGKYCDECVSSHCTYHTADGKYVYNLRQLAQENFDYTYALTEYEIYYVNILAHTNKACGDIPSAACQYWRSKINDERKTYSLGRPSTAQIQQLSGESSAAGVQVSYSNGSPCESGPNNRSSVLQLLCTPGGVTSVQQVNEVSLCAYELVVTSPLACPNCTEGRYGSSCSLCTCVHGVCSQGIHANGECACSGLWSGKDCDQCSNGWGPLCTACTCQGGACNSTSGECSCYSGYQGKDCSECKPNHFGSSCQPCTCGLHGVCNDTRAGDGFCQCQEGFAGASCDACSAGYYGDSCTACNCNKETSVCLDGITENGACICLAGFTGSDCTREPWDAQYFAAIGGTGIAVGFFVGAAVSALICMCWLGRRLKYQPIE